jgi:uncharacterized protein with von Willebrand factor type A (vWA) domain
VPDATDPLAVITRFGRVLRAAGVDADAGRVAAFTEALGHLDAARSRDVYWAGRLTLCADPDDLPRYDAAFGAVFGRRLVRLGGVPEQVEPVPVPPAGAAGDDPALSAVEGSRQRMRSAASVREQLHTRDIAGLTADERAELNRLLAAFALPGELRPARRHRPSARGPIDRRRTTAAALAAGGEPARLHRHRHRPRPRRVVLLVDISGSMAPYADALLRFAHAARRGAAPVEVFTLGTRLTRVTRALSHRDPQVALRAVAAAVPDWSGGTRLGGLLREFTDVWGQRGMARGAIVVLLSDGWERGDPALLGAQVARLQRLAYRLIWVNPLRGRPGYAPLAAGMAAALPHVDEFVAGHSIEALERVAGLVAGRREAIHA